MKKCKKENCNYNVWSKGYCQNHQHLRIDYKRNFIKPVSDKTKELNKKYHEVKRLMIISERKLNKGVIRCKFCSGVIGKNQEIDGHHLISRKNKEYLLNPKNIWLCHRFCHTGGYHNGVDYKGYHNMTMEEISRSNFVNNLLIALKELEVLEYNKFKSRIECFV